VLIYLLPSSAMGAQAARLPAAIRECAGEGFSPDAALELIQGTDSLEVVLKVVHAPIDDTRGARLSGYEVGEELKVIKLSTIDGLDPLGWRYREKFREQWPQSYRFQASKRCWQVRVTSDSSLGPEQVCLLQMSSSTDDRTLEHVQLDVDDARVAAVYAQRFNRHQLQALDAVSEPQGPQENPTFESIEFASHDQVDQSGMPSIKVAAPVACEVVHSGYPSMVPVRTFCTLTPYAEKDVQKFVFDSQSDEFLELPQAYFHYAAFSSNGKEYVCDIQGVQDDDGSFLIVDPCVLKAGLPTVRDLVGVATNGNVPGELSGSGPTAERFDALHPKCTQACKVFDPHRRSAMRNKAGMCGMGTCGMTFAKCGR
jgi:hypothetical protein